MDEGTKTYFWAILLGCLIWAGYFLFSYWNEQDKYLEKCKAEFGGNTIEASPAGYVCMNGRTPLFTYIYEGTHFANSTDMKDYIFINGSWKAVK